MRRVYICSPYRPVGPDPETELKENLELAERACRLAVSKGYMPMAPHLYFTRFLDDNVPEDRELGMKLAFEWLRMVSELWYVGDRISPGMKKEMSLAQSWGVPIRQIRFQKKRRF